MFKINNPFCQTNYLNFIEMSMDRRAAADDKWQKELIGIA
jgi:hypothetical protein